MGLEECDPLCRHSSRGSRLGYFHVADNSPALSRQRQFDFHRILATLAEIRHSDM